MRTEIVVLALAAGVAVAGVREGVEAMNRGDYVTARNEFVPLANAGDTRAMVTLGTMYLQGQGVVQDYGQAMDWYLKAFEKGDGDGYSNIGVMYRDGLGVAENKKIAYCLFLITHVCSLGSESTQMRANSCLRRMVPLMTRDELIECFTAYTHDYIRAYVLSRGTLKGIPSKHKPGLLRRALKDEPWWAPGELDFLKEPAPGAAREPTTGAGPTTRIEAPAKGITLCYQFRIPSGLAATNARVDLAASGGIASGSLALCRRTDSPEGAIYEDCSSVRGEGRCCLMIETQNRKLQGFVIDAPSGAAKAGWSEWLRPRFVDAPPSVRFAVWSGDELPAGAAPAAGQTVEMRYRFEARTPAGPTHSKGAR